MADDEFISVGHCLCRFEKELIGDSCRVNMPMETCMSIGPAAEHLIEQGISRKISKNEAIKELIIYNSLGGKMIQKEYPKGNNTNPNKITLDLSSLETGLYIVYSKSERGGTAVQKIVKE